MGGGERARHLGGNVDGFVQCDWTARETLTQRFAIDQLAGNIRGRVGFTDLVDRDDVWMIQRGRGARFPL